MKNEMIITGIVLSLVVSVSAQSPSNVEKANRFRASQVKTAIVVETPQARNIELKNTAFSRYADGLESNAQLKELGSCYADGLESNAQLRD